MRPFLLLSTRAEEVAADDEYAGFLRAAGLEERELRRIRVEAGPLPELDLDDYAGILLGGSPFNASDAVETKSQVQRRVERELGLLLDRVVERDFPFLGACYGIGTLGIHQGGVVDRTYGEPISAVRVELTPAGADDPLLAGLPAAFDAFVGHKEACRVLPPSATLLAASAGCPVQMFRVGRNVYATQFHPELDVAGLVTRIHVYRDAGYFPPSDVDELVARVSPSVVTEPARILTSFVARFAWPLAASAPFPTSRRPLRRGSVRTGDWAGTRVCADRGIHAADTPICAHSSARGAPLPVSSRAGALPPPSVRPVPENSTDPDWTCDLCGRSVRTAPDGPGGMIVEVAGRGLDGEWWFWDAGFCSQEHAAQWLGRPLPTPPGVDHALQESSWGSGRCRGCSASASCGHSSSWA